MTNAFDKRLIRVGIELNGVKNEFEDLAIIATGQKFASAVANQCEVRMYNLKRDLRNYLLTEASPLKKDRTPAQLTLEIGRESYGTSLLFAGSVFAANATQPPDIGIIFQSLTNSLRAGIILGYQENSTALLSSICGRVADLNGLVLDFQATDRNIENFSYSGAVNHLINKIERMGGVRVSVDDDKTLTVLDADKARVGAEKLINQSTGMIGIPQVLETGIIVKVLADNNYKLFDLVYVESEINPAVNGRYVILQIHFQVANRDQPFWFTMVCSNLELYQGTQ